MHSRKLSLPNISNIHNLLVSAMRIQSEEGIQSRHIDDQSKPASAKATTTVVLDEEFRPTKRQSIVTLLSCVSSYSLTECRPI